MKFLANLFYCSKELFWFIFIAGGMLLMEMSIVFILYLFAHSADIPFTNFDVFMENIYLSILGLMIVSIFMCIAVQSYGRLFYLLCINVLFTIIAISIGKMHMERFEQFFIIIFKGWIAFIVLAILNTILYRVVMNTLFRQSFTKEFLEKCAIYPSEQNFFYSIKGIKQVVHFFCTHTRKTTLTYFSPDDWEDTFVTFSEDFEGDVPFITTPIEIKEEPHLLSVRFPYFPQPFTFKPQTEFIKEIEEPVLLNQKKEK